MSTDQPIISSSYSDNETCNKTLISNPLTPHESAILPTSRQQRYNSTSIIINESLLLKLDCFKILNYDYTYILMFDYIEIFYNTVKIHSDCVYLSPVQYEKEYFAGLNERVKCIT